MAGRVDGIESVARHFERMATQDHATCGCIIVAGPVLAEIAKAIRKMAADEQQ